MCCFKRQALGFENRLSHCSGVSKSVLLSYLPFHVSGIVCNNIFFLRKRCIGPHTMEGERPEKRQDTWSIGRKRIGF